MMCAEERKGRIIGLKYMACNCYNHTTKCTTWPPKQEHVSNSQNMYICDNSLFLQCVTPFEHICLSFLVAEGGRNDMCSIL